MEQVCLSGVDMENAVETNIFRYALLRKCEREIILSSAKINDVRLIDDRKSKVVDMEKNTSRTLNEMLVKLFNSFMDMEKRAIMTKEFADITNNDMHIIEAIGVDEPRSMSVIAKRMDVTVGTLTTNMNSLEVKGYIMRERSKVDKRVVFVLLTDKGKKVFYHHRDFHKRMIKSIIKDLDEDEMNVLIKSLLNLNGFFDNKDDQ